MGYQPAAGVPWVDSGWSLQRTRLEDSPLAYSLMIPGSYKQVFWKNLGTFATLVVLGKY